MLSISFIDHQLMELEILADSIRYDLNADQDYLDACWAITDQQMELESQGQQYSEMMVDAVPAYKLLYNVMRRMGRL